MDKNLSKLGAVFFVAIAIILLLIYGNPYAPPIIEDGSLKLGASKDIKKPLIEVTYNSSQILTFSPEVILIQYNNKTMPVFAYNGKGYSNMEAMFNGNDSKNVEIKGNTMIITYFNKAKDPKEAGIIFTLENDTLLYRVTVNASNPENLGQFQWRASTEKYKTIITPSDENIDNEAGKEGSRWSKSIQIPESDKNYELLLSNETMLNISGNFTSIGYMIKNKGAMHYLNYGESLNIRIQKPVELNLTEKGLSLRASEKVAGDNNIYLYNKNDKILTFSPEVILIQYNNKTMPVFAYNGKGYSNMEAMFNGNDSKNVEIKGNTMIITYFNKAKDPKEAGIIFTLENDTLLYRVTVNASNPENLGQFQWRASTEKYKTIITPSDENIDNEAGKEGSRWSKSIQIPESDKNYELLLSNETMLNISGNFTSIAYMIKNKGAMHYLNYGESLNIRIQKPVELNLTEKGLSLRASEKVAGDNNIYLYNKNDKILTFSPEVILIQYNNKTMPVFAYNGKGYSNMEAMFNGNDSKNVEIKGNTMIITYFNKAKDPKEAGIIFTLENDTLLYRVTVNASNPENLGQFQWRASTEKYKTIITPSDENIDNEAGKEGSRWSKSIQIPESDKNYELLLSNETMLNISGNFTSIAYMIKNKGAMHYLNYSESLKIRIQKPTELNLTQKYPLTISTSSAISDGIHIYKNGTKILSLSTWEAIFKHDGRTQRLLSSLKYDEDYPNKLLFNYNNSAKITKISEIKQNNKTTGYEMNVSWVNESRDVQEIGFSIKIYENKSYAEIKYIYRTKNAYVNLEPLSYGISFDKNKFTYIKVVKNSEITGNIKRSPVENEKKGYLNFAGCEQGKCDKIIADQWFIDKGDKNYEKAVEIKGNFSRIEHYFTYNIVRFYMDDFKEPLKIYVD